jgi:hypothetical protein
MELYNKDKTQLYPDLMDDPRAMMEHLESYADDVHSGQYFTRPLQEFEVEELKTEVAEASMKLQALEEELKGIMDDFKTKINPLKEKIKFDVAMLRVGKRNESGNIYLIVDEEDGKERLFNASGMLIEERSIRRKQKTIHQQLRDAHKAHPANQ